MSKEKTKFWVVLEGKYELGGTIYKRHLFTSRREAEQFKATLQLPNQLFQLEQVNVEEK